MNQLKDDLIRTISEYVDIDRAGIYTGLIRDRVDVEPFRNHLLSGNFGLISLPKAYRKHLVVGDSIEV